jgi:hypothetical protein
MLYSLPTGKVIELSVEQYIELTDEELEYLISINYGEAIENPFFGSILSKPIIIEFIPDDVPPPTSIIPIEEEDTSIDYHPEEE